MSTKIQHTAIFVSGFNTGGVPRVMSQLSTGLAEYCARVDFVVAKLEPGREPNFPQQVRLIDLSKRRRLLPIPPRANTRAVLTSVPALRSYLREVRPQLLLAGGNYANFTALVGAKLAGTGIPVIVSHHSDFDHELARKPFARWITRHIYPRADAIVAVSQGVADRLAAGARLNVDDITRIYNPALPDNLAEQAQEAVEHPWLAPGQPPVILSAGRLHPQKDFPTLLRAFARVRASRKLRLIILGTGKNDLARDELMTLARSIGIAADFDLPGYVLNPFSYMSRAAAFVLSSAWEGFGNVLVEALGCACPVVSTDCPSGPSEILDGGKYGPLVPVGDDVALAQAILQVLDNPIDKTELQRRAAEFSVARATREYLELMRRLVAYKT